MSKLVHFLEIDGPGTRPLCQQRMIGDGQVLSTVFIERVTCPACLEALNRRLARDRARASLARDDRDH